MLCSVYTWVVVLVLLSLCKLEGEIWRNSEKSLIMITFSKGKKTPTRFYCSEFKIVYLIFKISVVI